jgi:nuclear transcription Y subunit beta
MADSGGGGGGSDADAIRDQDRLLPIANISRIMKRVLPDHAKMSKESKSSIQECVSEFIGFITSEASDRLSEDKRKTITGDDVIDAMRALGFDNYVEFLLVYLKKYRLSSKGGKNGEGERGGGGGGGGSAGASSGGGGGGAAASRAGPRSMNVASGGGGGGGGGGGAGGDKGKKRKVKDEDDSAEDDDDDDDDDDDGSDSGDDKQHKRRRSD